MARETERHLEALTLLTLQPPASLVPSTLQFVHHEWRDCTGARRVFPDILAQTIHGRAIQHLLGGRACWSHRRDRIQWVIVMIHLERLTRITLFHFGGLQWTIRTRRAA